MGQDRIWKAPGESVTLAGHDIPGGLVYVGTGLRSPSGGVEPALINPALPVDQRLPDSRDRPVELPPAPAYHLIATAQRAGYLAWLAGGRADPQAPIGYLQLFVAGLERRVLVDARTEPAVVRAELPAIATEVRRLRALHGPQRRSFEARAHDLLEVLDLLTAPVPSPGRPRVEGTPPTPGGGRTPVPTTLRVALAQFAAAATPVPPEWARCWAWYHPSLFPRTPQTRCPREFDALFALRYRRRLPNGLRPGTADRPPVRIGYRPANAGLDTVVVERPDLPDVLEEPTATRDLGALVDDVTDALTPYSRWLARTPGGEGSVASTVLLPGDLLDHHPGPLAPLLTWAGDRLAGRPSAVVDGRELRPFWSSADPDRMSREESAGLAVVLGRAGLAVEPDVRFAAPPLGPGPAVLFRLDPQAGDRPGAEFTATALALAVAVSAGLPTLGPSQDDVNRAITAAATEARLTVADRSRLAARLCWLLAAGAGPAGPLRRRADALTPAQRDCAGRILVAFTTVGPAITAGTVAALETAYRTIGEPADLLHRRLHRQPLPDDDEPVVVRRGRPTAAGRPLPRSAAGPTAGGAAPALDESVLRRTLAESDAVAALLGDIFSDADPATATATATATASDPATDTAPATETARARETEGSPDAARSRVAAQSPPTVLDAVHRDFLQQLRQRPRWVRRELVALATGHDLLLSGAIDVINEAALELVGEPVLGPDDDPGGDLDVDLDVLEELLG